MFSLQYPSLEVSQRPKLYVSLCVFLEDALNAGSEFRPVLLQPVIDALLEIFIIFVAFDDGLHSAVEASLNEGGEVASGDVLAVG